MIWWLPNDFVKYQRSFQTFISDVPSSPVLSSLEKEAFSCKVSLVWETPSDHGCPLIMYTVYYRQLEPQQSGAPWHGINITNVVPHQYFLALTCDTLYEIEMTAWNEVGQSDRSESGMIKTSSGRLCNTVTVRYWNSWSHTKALLKDFREFDLMFFQNFS